MTIRSSINAKELSVRLSNLEECADHAPEGTYEEAKRLRRLLGDTCDAFMSEAKSLGLKTPNCDQIREVEAILYGYIIEANPLRFNTAEGFGSSMSTPARDRVIAQAKSNRDFLLSRRA